MKDASGFSRYATSGGNLPSTSYHTFADRNCARKFPLHRMSNAPLQSVETLNIASDPFTLPRRTVHIGQKSSNSIGLFKGFITRTTSHVLETLRSRGRYHHNPAIRTHTVRRSSSLGQACRSFTAHAQRCGEDKLQFAGGSVRLGQVHTHCSRGMSQKG